MLLGIGVALAAGLGSRSRLLGLPVRLKLRPARYRRLWPAVFLIAAALVILGAAIHPPNNIDAVTYRLPRVMHWLASGQWHWIDTVDPRQNYSGCGQEWLMAPLIALTGTDRLTWIWNAVAWLLLPGLLFSMLRDFGVRGRTAWTWMWLLPLAPVYLLQAGSTANDLLGAAYFVAAMAFAGQARKNSSCEPLAYSILAIGLATGVKASNLPLVLPWLMMAVPAIASKAGCLKVWLAGLFAVAVSALPTLAANRACTGTWTGDPSNVTAVQAGRPWSGLIGNTLQCGIQNLQPPVFPWAEQVEGWARAGLEPAVRRCLRCDFPRFTTHLTELAQEEWAGLGGLVVLLLLGAWVWPRRRPAPLPAEAERSCRPMVFAGGGVACLAFFAVMGSEMTARLLAPYYPLAVAAALVGCRPAWWVGMAVFRTLAIVAILGSAVALGLSPARPLFPVPWILKMLAPMDKPAPEVVSRARVLYGVYAERSDPLAALRAHLPAGVRLVGFMASPDDSEISFWMPFGKRRVETVRPSDAGSLLRGRGISWMVARSDVVWPDGAGKEQWLRGHSATVVEERAVLVKARKKPEDWLLVRID